jgi:hypothetical protein
MERRKGREGTGIRKERRKTEGQEGERRDRAQHT